MRKNSGRKGIEYCSLEELKQDAACFNDVQFSTMARETAWQRELLGQWLAINMGVTASYAQQQVDEFNRCLHQEITRRYLPQIIF